MKDEGRTMKDETTGAAQTLDELVASMEWLCDVDMLEMTCPECGARLAECACGSVSQVAQ